MSEQNTPSKEASSTSAMDSSTFYSMNDSDFEKLNATDIEHNLLLKIPQNDSTLKNLSESTLHFILDEQNNQKSHDNNKSGTSLANVPGGGSADTTIKTNTTNNSSNSVGGNSLNNSLTSNEMNLNDDSSQLIRTITENLDTKNKINNSDRSIIDLNDTSFDEAILITSSESEDENSFEDSSRDVQNLSADDNKLKLDGSNKQTDEVKSNSAEEPSPTEIETPPPAQKKEIVIYDTIEEFEANLPHTITVLNTTLGSKVYLVGTAHFSEESMDDVSFAIRNVEPQVVMVELCSSRIHILKHDEKTLMEEARNINVSKVVSIIRQNGLIDGLFYIVLLNTSANLIKELGMLPGGEFRRALEEVFRLQNCTLHLGDRPINITLQRALCGLSIWQQISILWSLLTTNETITAIDVEKCKEKDLLEQLMEEMAVSYPTFRDVFVTERDLYLCHSLQVAALPQLQPNGQYKPVRVVGIVGIGHCAGITQNWENVDSDRIPEITKIPPSSLSTRITKYTLKYGILALITYGIFRVVRPRVTHLF